MMKINEKFPQKKNVRRLYLISENIGNEGACLYFYFFNQTKNYLDTYIEDEGR